jgi:DNA segregation ATPase FtsK/SpoIIIE-like protein
MDDPVYMAAKELANHHTRLSPSMLQRRLEIGGVKATAIIERLTAEGILGAPEGGESRPVLRDDDLPVEFD